MSVELLHTVNQRKQISSQVQENSTHSSITTLEQQLDTERTGNHGDLSASDTRFKTSLATKKLSDNHKPRRNYGVLKEHKDSRFGGFSGRYRHYREFSSYRPKNDLSSLQDKNAPSTVQDHRSKPEVKACRFYYKYGYCHFGLNCRFLHQEIRSRTPKETRKQDVSESETFLDVQNLPSNSKNKDEYKNRRFRSHFNHYQEQEYGKTTLKSNNSSKQKAEFQHTLASGDLDCNVGDQVEGSQLPATSISPKETKKPLSVTRKEKSPVKKRQCWYFTRYGNCRYGDNCKYSHLPSVSQDGPHNLNDSKDSVTPDDSVQNKEIISEKENPEVQVPKTGQLTGQLVHILDCLTDEDLKSLRQTEITQLMKRFPRCEVLKDDNSGSEFIIEFIPSDPDWPFEVKSLQLKVLLEPDYPVQMCIVEVLDTADRFPESLIQFLQQSIQRWFKIRHEENSAVKIVEVAFKPFLRWLDRNLEDLFIMGLKKVKKEKEAKDAGIEFIPYESLQFAPSADRVHQSEEEEIPPNVSSIGEKILPSFAEPKETESLASTPKRGTEIVLRSMEFGDKAATLVCRKISLTLQCGRCKNRNDVESPSNRANRVFCSRCHHVQAFTFRPQMMHQFSVIMGYLDLTGCQVIDLPIVNCNFDISCLNCSQTMPYNGLHFGQRSNIWCSHCNSKMTIFVESVKFQHLQPSTNKDGKLHLLRLECKERRVKDPAIQEGKPLPDDGTCKHYKKSYRWLRFPCCGKAYPCDKCHAEKETDHEMKYATRMICGFCAKEQPYANDKECILCKSSVTKKSTAHWEGGKGCRDKLTMSRADPHKYVGTNKTLSRKLPDKAKPSSKK